MSTGYAERFIKEQLRIEQPKLAPEEYTKFVNSGLEVSDYALDYTHYSLLHNPFRKFPYYTACNINGKQYQGVLRHQLFDGKGDRWLKDNRIPKRHQWGHELYKAERSDFDKGHLTKRQDTQWGIDEGQAIKAAESTFYFTNAMPQVDRLNRGVWRRIEDYILHHETVAQGLKVSSFTGPVFTEHDPTFVTPVEGEIVSLPVLFWKVVYYMKGEQLMRTGFLTSQKGLLEKRRITKAAMRGVERTETTPFMDFKDAETYQVQVAFIEKLSRLGFAPAEEHFKEDRPEALILSGVDVRSGGQDIHNGSIKNLIL